MPQSLVDRLGLERVQGQKGHGRHLLRLEVVDGVPSRPLGLYHDGVHLPLHGNGHREGVALIDHLGQGGQAPVDLLGEDPMGRLGEGAVFLLRIGKYALERFWGGDEG